MTVRERVDRLFDPGSFHETGALAGRGMSTLGSRVAAKVMPRSPAGG